MGYPRLYFNTSIWILCLFHHVATPMPRRSQNIPRVIMRTRLFQPRRDECYKRKSQLLHRLKTGWTYTALYNPTRPKTNKIGSGNVEDQAVAFSSQTCPRRVNSAEHVLRNRSLLLLPGPCRFTPLALLSVRSHPGHKGIVIRKEGVVRFLESYGRMQKKLQE